MAKRTVVWTETAARQQREILKYWIHKTGTKVYAEKLLRLTASHIRTIQKHPGSFKMTNYPDTRVSPFGHFSLFYKISEERIIIMAFWDNRQNPKKLHQLISEPGNRK